jgi:hypothetical protein
MKLNNIAYNIKSNIKNKSETNNPWNKIFAFPILLIFVFSLNAFAESVSQKGLIERMDTLEEKHEREIGALNKKNSELEIKLNEAHKDIKSLKEKLNKNDKNDDKIIRNLNSINHSFKNITILNALWGLPKKNGDMIPFYKEMVGVGEGQEIKARGNSLDVTKYLRKQCKDKRSCTYNFVDKLGKLDPYRGLNKTFRVKYRCGRFDREISVTDQNKKIKINCGYEHDKEIDDLHEEIKTKERKEKEELKVKTKELEKNN